MDLTVFKAALSTLVSFAFIGGTYLVFKKANNKESTIRLWFLYLSISILWSLLITAGQFIQRGVLSDIWVIKISHYSVLFLTLITLILSYYNFDGGKTQFWSLYGLCWLGLYFLVDDSPLSLERLLKVDQSLSIAQQSLAKVVLITGWVIVMGEMTRFLTKLYRKTPQKLLKNQISYWTLALIFFSIGDGLIFADFLIIGIIFHWVGTVIITNVLLVENLPEISQIEQYILYYVITSIITACVLVLSIFIALPLFQEIGRENPTFAGAVFTISIAALLSLIWILSARLLSRYLPLISGDPDRILHEYSQSISDILDAERLGQTAIQLICNEFDIQHGYLFVVDFHTSQEENIYILKSTNNGSRGKPIPGKLADGSLIVKQLHNKRRILKQSDIEIYQHMKTISKDEQNWMRALNTEIYIPIHTKDEWVGLFALGSKNSDNPYFDNEIKLLNIIADQTAVALNNALLVESLMRLNNDFRRAYKALEQTNVHLKRSNLILENLESTKSDFIQIASRELKTPFTMMSGYNEQLLEDPKISQDKALNKLTKGIYAGLVNLEEIITGMMDVMYIDARSLQLNVESVTIKSLTRLSIDSFMQVINDRNLTISIESMLDLPQIEADPVAIQKVFYHLISNAIKFTPIGGTINISGQILAPDELGFSSGGVQITVSDNGNGIDPEYLGMIFTKYSNTGKPAKQLSENIKFMGESPKLGLLIAKGIVEAHNGKIWAESLGFDEHLRPGSKFHFALPINHYDYPSSVSIKQHQQVK